MSQDKAILYDLPHKGSNPYTCWSPNVWKTRLVLNYKKIPYTSEFLEHKDIEPKLISLGISPNPPPPANQPGPKQSPYTLPAMRLPDGTYAQDSANIAPKLEEQCPEPSLLLETGLHLEAQRVLGEVAGPLLSVVFPAVARNIVMEHYADWWVEKKEIMLGMSMPEFEATGGEYGNKAWKAAEPGFVEMKEFLASNKKDEGPFILGSRPSYGDFVIASMLEALMIIENGLFERFVGYDEQLRELHSACREWFVKNE